ncbi:hypothetical protein KAT36_00045 [Candidatus Pacearchaeota archaeon]|nr:hypothetical protein [Candidatus Pacearchaeota archaeon]
MKKMMALALIGMFVLSFGFASAKTLVAGKIYNADYSDVIGGADVTVSCDHNGVVSVGNTISLGDGSYGVEFDEIGSNACNNGDFLTVYAEKGSLTGMNSGEINDDVIGDWDLAVVNVPLVPEFGFVVGMLTVLSAVCVFFVVRKD